MIMSKKEEFLRADYLVEEDKVSKNYNKENAINYLIVAVDVINEEEKKLEQLNKAKKSTIFINCIAQIYQEIYSLPVKENFYNLNRTIGRDLVTYGVTKDEFEKLKKSVNEYINMLTDVNKRISKCL